MKKLGINVRTLALFVVIIPLLALFIYVGLRSGPLAPVEVTVVSVESRALTPAVFGIGTVEARYTYKIGPTMAGRIKSLNVDVGDKVTSGQLLGEMDSVDFDDRVHSLDAALSRAKALLQEANARLNYAQAQARRYEQLFTANLTSDELVKAKQQELQIAQASLLVAQQEILRVNADRSGVIAQRNNLRLIAPVDGVVIERSADPGTTIVAGKSVVEIIDPNSIWINVRFDQISASGLDNEQAATIVLRSRSEQLFKAKVLRVELKADAITEEMLAKVVFETLPDALPPLGELAEVSVELPETDASPTIPNAAIRRVNNTSGVWLIRNEELSFVEIELGARDLDGFVQVKSGLKNGEQVVLYSEKTLSAKSAFNIVDKISGVQ